MELSEKGRAKLRELMPVPGHVVGCLCDGCEERKSELVATAYVAIEGRQARESRAFEARVPSETRRIQAAKTELTTARSEVAAQALVVERLGDELNRQDRAAERRASIVGELTAEDRTAFLGATQRGEDLSRREKRARKELSRREKRMRIALREIDPYSEGSPHSWIADTVAARAALEGSNELMPHQADPGYEERLSRHANIVARAVAERTKYGKQIIAGMGQECRSEDVALNRKDAEKAVAAEIRALTTGGGATASASGGSAAAFVTPAILMDVWATYRSPTASFINECVQVPLPPYGMQAYIPIVTTGTTVATNVEGNTTAEGDPVTGFASGAIVSKAGQVTLSQASVDRVGPGITGDVVICRQLKEQLQSQVDVYGLTLVIASAATVAGISTFALTASGVGVGGLLGDLKKAKSKLTDTAGVRLRGTHCFAVDDFVDYLEAYSDGQSRPVFSPDPVAAADQSDGFSGFSLSSLGLWGDTNIPTSGSNLQIVVCRADTIVHLQSPVVCDFLPQFGAGNLDPVIRVRQYCTTIPRFPTGVAVITGNGYAATTFE